MKNENSLTGVRLVDSDHLGYWQIRGWSDDATYRTMSRLDVRASRGFLPTEETVVGGIAFAGDRGIKGVEVSFDGGKTWETAQGKEALGPYTWVLWAARWRPPSPGTCIVKVRATDGKGEMQTEAVTEPLPDGATGLHTVYLRVTG